MGFNGNEKAVFVFDVKKVAMPIIECWLDRLKWNMVSGIIKESFDNTDIEILVCKREEEI